MKIHILHCGTVNLSTAAIGGGRSGLSAIGRKLVSPNSSRKELPVTCYLIEHPRGLVLVDTGWCRDISPNGTYDAQAAKKVLGAPLASFYKPELKAGQAIDEQLLKLGIRPSDLDLVIITHLDPDHVSGVKHVSDARRIIMPEDEYFWSCRTVYKLRQPWKLWMDYPIERVYYRGFPNVPNNWAVDIFGDETLYMVNLPGHTDGMAGIVAVNGSKFVLMCADAGFSSHSWEALDVPGFGFDPRLQLKSLKWVKEMSERAGCVGVFASHDANVMPQTIEF